MALTQVDIDEEALAGPDGPPPRKLTPEWVAVNLMDITAHLMAAIDKAATRVGLNLRPIYAPCEPCGTACAAQYLP